MNGQITEVKQSRPRIKLGLQLSISFCNILGPTTVYHDILNRFKDERYLKNQLSKIGQGNGEGTSLIPRYQISRTVDNLVQECDCSSMVCFALCRFINYQFSICQPYNCLTSEWDAYSSDCVQNLTL